MCFFSLSIGTALILAKMPQEKITEGLRALCLLQINPLNQVSRHLSLPFTQDYYLWKMWLTNMKRCTAGVFKLTVRYCSYDWLQIQTSSCRPYNQSGTGTVIYSCKSWMIYIWRRNCVGHGWSLRSLRDLLFWGKSLFLVGISTSIIECTG